MFRAKICGLTTLDDARQAARAGADALGLNFYPQSPRYIDISVARAITAELPPQVKKIGLFVNASLAEIQAIQSQIPLDLIQLHGDESPQFLTEISLPIIKAFRIGPIGLQSVVDYLSECRAIGRLPDLCLLDAHKAGQYGGTGQTLDWQKLAAEKKQLFDESGQVYLNSARLVLSGGLNSSNVAEAIITFHPFAVDTASGVESAPGKKDHTLVQSFISTALAALNSLGRQAD